MIPSDSSNRIKNEISPQLQLCYHVIDNMPTKRSHEPQFKCDSYRLNSSKTSPYKRISIKKL